MNKSEESDIFLNSDDTHESKGIEYIDLFDPDEDECDEPLTKETNQLYEHFRFVADKKQSLLRIDKFLIDKIGRAHV